MPDTSIIQAFVVAVVLTVDTLVVSFALAANKIKIPFLSAAILALLSTLVLTIGMLAGKGLSVYIPKSTAALVCHTSLIAVGLYKAFADFFQTSQSTSLPRTSLYHAKILSTRQSLSLGLTLSLDSLAAGIGIGAGGGVFFWYIDFSLVLGITFIYIGNFLGRRLNVPHNLNLSWLCGAALILVGVSGLL